MIKSVVLALVTTAAALSATSAHAGGVSLSIGINAPAVGAVVSGGPGYYEPGYRQGYYGRVDEPAPVYEPVPVYVPAPVYRVPPRVDYYPPAVVYRSAPVVYSRYYPDYYRGHRDGWDRDQDRDDRRERHERQEWRERGDGRR